MKKIATLILGLALGLTALAQSAKLSGTIRDAANQSVAGAFIVEQGTTNGTMSEADGSFSIVAPVGAVLEVSCIGYLTQTITVADGAPLNIVLE